MNWLSANLQSMVVAFRNVFRPMNTEPLPWKAERPRAERYRTSFALVHDEHGDEACIGCKMCEKICPSFIITVVAGGRAASEKTGKQRGWCKDFTLDLNACIHCELCVQVCPTDAIVMLREQAPPTYSREDMVLTMERLYQNESKVKSWGTGARLIGMQEQPKAEKPKPAEKPAEKAAEKPAGEASS